MKVFAVLPLFLLGGWVWFYFAGAYAVGFIAGRWGR